MKKSFQPRLQLLTVLWRQTKRVRIADQDFYRPIGLVTSNFESAMETMLATANEIPPTREHGV